MTGTHTARPTDDADADPYPAPAEDGEDDTDRAGALKRTLRFTYRHSTALVPLSVLWALASLPLVAVGPATLGAYAAVCSLRETGRVDRERVLATVRENLVHAALLGILPVVFVAVAALNASVGGTVASVLAVGSLYAGVYLAAVLVPTFVGLAGGEDTVPAIRQGYLWTAANPAVTVHLVVVTLVVTFLALVSTVGFVLLFAGVLATYHVEIVADEILDEATPAASQASPTPEMDGVVP